MRSICPDSVRRGGSPAANKANLRLEEPAFTQRTEAIEQHGTQQIAVRLGFQSGKGLRDEAGKLFSSRGARELSQQGVSSPFPRLRRPPVAGTAVASPEGQKRTREDST